MIKLHGFAVSNYTCMVELALLEKGIPFEYVLTMPSQDAALLARSPRGKLPFIETPQGCVNETSVILDYLEDLGTGRPLLPADAWGRAYVRSLMKEIELYIELPARACFGEAFFGVTVPEPIKAKSKDELQAGVAALGRHARFAPYVAGEAFTLADIVFLYTIELAGGVARQLFGLDLLADLPAARALLQRLKENEHVKGIAARSDAMMPSFVAAVRSRLGAR